MALRVASVRFYFDEDTLDLAKIVSKLRPDVTFPGDLGGVVHKRHRPASPVERGAKDPQWIPQIALRGWVIITHDISIQRHPSHLDAVRENGAKMVALSDSDRRGPGRNLRS